MLYTGQKVHTGTAIYGDNSNLRLWLMQFVLQKNRNNDAPRLSPRCFVDPRCICQSHYQQVFRSTRKLITCRSNLRRRMPGTTCSHAPGDKTDLPERLICRSFITSVFASARPDVYFKNLCCPTHNREAPCRCSVSLLQFVVPRHGELLWQVMSQ